MTRAFLTFIILLAASAATWGTPSPAGWPEMALPAARLADVALSANEIAMSVIGVVIALLGYHAVVGKYIRQQAGVKETQQMEITGQPIGWRHEKELLEKREHDEFKISIFKQHDELWKVVNGIRISVSKMEASVSALKALREANGDRLHEISNQFTDLAKCVHTLTGVVETKLKAARS